MILAAVKNYLHVAIVTNTADYQRILSELDRFGQVLMSTTRELIIKALTNFILQVLFVIIIIDEVPSKPGCI